MQRVHHFPIPVESYTSVAQVAEDHYISRITAATGMQFQTSPRLTVWPWLAVRYLYASSPLNAFIDLSYILHCDFCVLSPFFFLRFQFWFYFVGIFLSKSR